MKQGGGGHTKVQRDGSFEEDIKVTEEGRNVPYRTSKMALQFWETGQRVL